MCEVNDVETLPFRLEGFWLDCCRLRSQAQYFWGLSSLRRCLFNTKEHAKSSSKLQAVWPGIEAVHRQLWPGQSVPTRRAYQTNLDEAFVWAVPTSLLFSTVVWAVTAPKRSPGSKAVAGRLLRSLIALACTQDGGCQIVCPIYDEYGRCTSLESQTVDSTMVINCWSPGMSAAMSLMWDRDFMNPDRTVPSSSRARTDIADFVLWCLEDPGRGHNRLNLDQRRILKDGAMILVTQIALQFETVVCPKTFQHHSRLLNEPHGSSSEEEQAANPRRGLRGKRTRLTSSVANMVAAKAATLLFSGKDCQIYIN